MCRFKLGSLGGVFFTSRSKQSWTGRTWSRLRMGSDSSYSLGDVVGDVYVASKDTAQILRVSRAQDQRYKARQVGSCQWIEIDVLQRVENAQEHRVFRLVQGEGNHCEKLKQTSQQTFINTSSSKYLQFCLHFMADVTASGRFGFTGLSNQHTHTRLSQTIGLALPREALPSVSRNECSLAQKRPIGSRSSLA